LRGDISPFKDSFKSFPKREAEQRQSKADIQRGRGIVLRCFLSAAILLGVVLSVTSLVLEELSFKRYPKISSILVLFLYAILDNFGYRQMHTWWRFRGCIDYILKKKNWGKMKRKRFQRRGSGQI